MSEEKPTRSVEERLEINRKDIIHELGYMAARGNVIRCVKIYRAIYGVGLDEAKAVIKAAMEEARRLYHM